MARKYPKLASTLKRLLFERNIKPVDLARAVGLPPPTIHRLVTGKSTRPYKSSLEPIADFFSMTVDELLEDSKSKKNIKFNSKAELPFPGAVSKIPLVLWEDIEHRHKNIYTTEIPFLGEISSNSFATVMPDTSMEPFIHRSSILIFDGNLQPTDRSYVLARLNAHQAFTVRQLLIDADAKYLKPLNSDLSSFDMKLLNEKDEIIACLVEVRHNLLSGNTSLTKESSL